MKKELKSKKVQKLNLTRETLRQLSEPSLKAVVGEATASQCSNRCTVVSCLC